MLPNLEGKRTMTRHTGTNTPTTRDVDEPSKEDTEKPHRTFIRSGAHLEAARAA